MFLVPSAEQPKTSQPPGDLLDADLPGAGTLSDLASAVESTAAPASPVTLPPVQRKKPPKRSVSLPQGVGVADFVVGHGLMMVVIVFAVIAFLVGAMAVSLTAGLILGVIGLVIAPFGLLRTPRPNQSQSGAVVASLMVLWIAFNLIRMAVSGRLRVPHAESIVVPIAFYIGVLIGVCILLVFVLIAYFVFRRFGFFRPAAWTYVVLMVPTLMAMIGLAGPGSTAGPDAGIPADHPAFRNLIAKHGEQNVVTLQVSGLVGDSRTLLLERVRSLDDGIRDIFGTDSGGWYCVSAAPVGDAEAFAANIDFGKVIHVDGERRIVKVIADPSAFAGSGEPASAPSDVAGRQLADSDPFAGPSREKPPALEPPGRRTPAGSRGSEEDPFAALLESAASGSKVKPKPGLAGKTPPLGMADDTSPPAGAVSGPLKQALTELARGNTFEQREALKQLAAMEPVEEQRDKVVAALKSAASGGSHFVQIEAIKALGTWHTPEVIPDLLNYMQDENPFLREAAIQAAAKTKDPRVVAVLIQRLGDFHDRDEAARALMTMGPPVEDALLDQLGHPDADVVVGVCNILAQVGTVKSRKKLARYVRHPNMFVRNAAQRAVQMIKTRD